MRHVLHSAVCVGVLGLLSAPALAGISWCAANHPDAIFCDDYDRYCYDLPPYPETCPGTGWSGVDLWRVWDPQGECGAMITLDDGFWSSPPYSARAAKGQLGYTSAPMSSYIRSQFGEGFSEVQGTDLHPLVFEFVINGKTVNKIYHGNAFMELRSGPKWVLYEQALTTWRLSPYCDEQCGDPLLDHTAYPIICRQQGAPAGCPDISTAPLRTSLAAGALAYLDTDPCHCNSGQHSSRNEHLAFFDGVEWWSLRQGLFPGGGTGGAVPGDFRLGNLNNRVRLTIMTNTVRVDHIWFGQDQVEGNGDDETSWCELPRAYLGPFGMLTQGYHIPCQLEAGTWNCNGAPDCNGPTMGTKACCVESAPDAGTILFDDIVLSGGQGHAAPGACCFDDTSCVEALYADCQTLGGHFAGSGTDCLTTPCCPPLPADQDMDGDVDLADFGWFQGCLSGTKILPATVPCQCADLNNDVGVDRDDLALFVNCMSGADIPADPGCMGSGE